LENAALYVLRIETQVNIKNTEKYETNGGMITMTKGKQKTIMHLSNE